MTQRTSRFGRSTGKNNATVSPNYRRWNNMRHRCHVESCKEYPRYGAKGITVCREWMEDFFTYDKYVMSLPNALKKGFTVDRVKSDGNYEPGNLRWSSATTQSRNCKVGSNNTSGVTGVTWCKQQKQWRANITVNYKTIRLGRFNTVNEAAKVRSDAEVKYGFK